MINNQLKFILVGEKNPSNDLQKDFESLIGQLATFSDIQLKKKGINTVTISYTGMPNKATLEIPKQNLTSEMLPLQQMVLTCEPYDYIALNLMRNVVGSIGYRVMNPASNCFLPKDIQLIDATGLKFDPKLAKIFEQFDFKPLFIYQNGLIFYALNNKDKSIHLINRHLLEYFLNNDFEIDPRKHKDFSLKVADDISHFVALQDRALIPISFYKYYNNPTKIMNLSGFDISNLETDVFIYPLFFELDPMKQSFKQKHENIRVDKLRKGASLETYFNKLSSFLAAKVATDMEYAKDSEGALLPRLSVSIFLDKN